MSTTLTGYQNTITTDDTYVLASVDPMARRTEALIALTKSGGYDGTALFAGRPRGSSQAFKTINYENPPGSGVQASPITPDAFIEVDATGMDVALVTTGRTVGALAIVVSMADQY